MYDLISRQAAIKAIGDLPDCPNGFSGTYDKACIIGILEELPSVQPETCEGCQHLGRWENEAEYGYPSPCTRCKRRVGDHYER